MMSFRRLAAGAFAVALLAVPLAATLFLTGCRKQEKMFIDTNLAPNTRLTSAPGPYSQANYRIHMYWDGTDPDGFVVAYHFAWDDTVPPYGADNSPWHFTTRGDSLFKALIDSAGETRRHTFYVRAVDNEGKLDPSAAKVRFDAWTVVPEITSLYRVGGPLDPSVPEELYPDGKDTVLMFSPVQFIWSGWDPDGLGAPIQYSFKMDSNPFEAYGDSTTATYPDTTIDPPNPPVSAGTHFFYVKAKDETGAENFPENYKFVMNFEPDSEILEPVDDTGTLVVADGDTIWFRWSVRDKERVLAPEDTLVGVASIWITLDNDFRREFHVDKHTQTYVSEWYFTSSVAISDSHYIESRNSPQGGNAQHLFEISSKDIQGTFERSSDVDEDREKFVFWYNYPPDATITYPAPGETLCPDFVVEWEGVDDDGDIAAYQFVLDPTQNAYRVCQVSLPDQPCTSWTYENVDVGIHEFRVRAQDNAGCWEQSWNTLTFFVTAALTDVTYPAPGDTVCPDFEITWSGVFDYGEIIAYEFSLDDADHVDTEICTVEVGTPCTSKEYFAVEPGRHEFQVRAQDDRGCWGLWSNAVGFSVEECK
jgi:hypothetical protein